ncbi:MAG TPA: hypothetical protein VFY71_11995 [Planctomycetota bacterium]|nr:hypothetical protein [Planctomycetota bacterium]
MTSRRKSPEPFDPIKRNTSTATDVELAGYPEDRLGLTLAEIRHLTIALGCDGAANEVWTELVARRRKAGG